MSRQVLTPQVSAQTVFVRLLHAHGSLMRSIEARLLAEHGLSANDFETLLHLSHAERGELRRIDLAERLRLTPSGVTRSSTASSVKADRPWRLPDRRPGHLRRDHREGPRDARAAACTHAAVCEEMIGADLSPAELDDLAALLGRLPGVDNVDARACAGGDARASPRARRSARRAPRLVRREIAQGRADVGSDRDALRRENPLHRRLTREALDAGPQLRE